MFLILRNMPIRVRCGRDRLRRAARDLVLTRLVESRILYKIPTLACAKI